MAVQMDLQELLTQITTNDGKIKVYQTDYHQHEHQHDGDRCIASISFDGLKPDADPVLVHYALALCYVMMEAYMKGIEEFTQVLKHDPAHRDAYVQRASLYSYRKEYQQAIDDYSAAIALTPLPELYNDRGIAYKGLKQYDQALADYAQAIQLKPELAAPYYCRALVYDALDDLEQAIADYDQALRLNPNYVEAYVNRGLAFLQTEKYDAAIADCTQAIALSPTFSYPYWNRARTYVQLKEYPQAIADFNKALEFDHDQRIYWERANTLELTGAYALAIQDYDIVIQASPQWAEAYYNRGRAYQQLGESTRARSDYGQAIALDPTLKEQASYL